MTRSSAPTGVHGGAQVRYPPGRLPLRLPLLLPLHPLRQPGQLPHKHPSAPRRRGGRWGEDAVGSLVTQEYVCDVLEKGFVLNTIGNRLFYVALPLLLWIFGPVLVFLSSVTMTAVMYNNDIVYRQGKKGVAKREEEDGRGGLSVSLVGRKMIFVPPLGVSDQ
ncbi:uncharacterized protein M6B38_321345 [Iris pallida]|uniref:Uncharacterized protein n=1 Tax=Iris pallida TaxID=29817 RepID=A0AAX6HCW1_IRIPA|nr:uncharacterized protein M6B38_321345 [Iris pallida]